VRVIVLVAVALVAASSAALAARASGPPVIREPFTKLPCPAKPKTTLDREGCAEKALLASDRRVDARVKTVWVLLAPGKARAAFAAGEKSWLAYRRSNCATQASKFAGGSEEPIAYLQCELDRNETHLVDLARMLPVLRGD
jgi:uncharacterized protein YecT (DUF1311 family)